MASILNPYLAFPGTAREAMEFYQAVLGGELQILTFGQMGQTDPTRNADAVMHSALTTPQGYALFAADMLEADADATTATGTERITVAVSGDDTDDLTRYFEGLSAGGAITVPLADQAWGDRFGMFTDRFGVPWMFNIRKEPHES
jgi:PhnB protein